MTLLLRTFILITFGTSLALAEEPTEESPSAAPAVEIPKTSAEKKEVLDEMIEDLEQSFTEPEARETTTTLEKIEDLHEDISEDIEELANRIDSFFVNENVVYGRNTTNIRVLNTLTDIEREGVSGDVDFKVRLQLPRLKDKIQFEVERQLDDYSVEGGQRVGPTALTQNRGSAASQNTRAGFSLFNDVVSVKTKLTAGLEYNKGFDPYANLRLSRNFKITRKQNFNTIFNFFAGVQDKTRQTSTFYYDIALKKNLLFRAANEATYRDINHAFDTTHVIYLFDEIDDRNSISYAAGMRANSPMYDSSYFVNEYFVGPSLRHRLYKRVLYVDGGPGLSWPKTQNFHSVWQFTVRLEVIFGKI